MGFVTKRLQRFLDQYIVNEMRQVYKENNLLQICLTAFSHKISLPEHRKCEQSMNLESPKQKNIRHLDLHGSIWGLFVFCELCGESEKRKS